MKKTVITIARSYGSGGKTLGKTLSEKLGIPCFDREVVRMASDESGVAEGLFGEADENIRKFILSNKARYQGVVLPPEDSAFTSDDNLFALQAEVIKKLADEGSCIIIGRCADYILKDRDDVYSFYFYASEENCMKRLREQTSGTDAEMRKKMESIDKHRGDYYKYYTGHQWNDVRNYDFCLDTGSMSYDKLADVVIKYIETRQN